MNEQTIFFTGAGGFIGKYILRHYVARGDCDLYLLEHRNFCQRLRTFVDTIVTDADKRSRIRILEGDITAPNLGLETGVARELEARMTRAIHLAAVYDLSVPKDIAVRINVEGTRNVLDFLGKTKQLERFGYMSTCATSGTFEGTFREDDLDVGQGFKNNYDETKFLAEKLVRERRESIPTVIFRPTYVVGDSKTGAFEKIDGPYYGLVVIARNMHFVIPNSGTAKCHAEPVDFVADAFYHLLEDEQSTGSVFNLADPNPITWNKFMALAAERYGKIKPPLKLPPALLKPMFRFTPFAHLTGLPYEAFKYSFHTVEYDTIHSASALAKYDISCPPLSAYIDVMIRFFKEHYGDAQLRRGKLYKNLS